MRTSLAAMLVVLALGGGSALAASHYGPGVSDQEIKIGQSIPYSGPLSFFASWGKTEAAYFAMINEHGGINGRKVTLLSLDDGGLPPKTFEQTRRLVEQDDVLAIFSTVGTPNNMAIRSYLKGKGVPQLFVASGATVWADHEHFPTSIGMSADYHIETGIYSRYILNHLPAAKIAVLYENDDFGKDLLAGLRLGLGAAADKMIVAIASYELTDSSVESQIATLQGSGADVFFSFATTKFTAQALQKTHALDWHPQQFVVSIAANAAGLLGNKAPEVATGVITASAYKSVTDDQWESDPGYREWLAFMTTYYADGNAHDPLNVQAYAGAQVLAQVLKQ
ncbi:MAG: branched-chain amino acid transporter substrate-binding protein [Rhodospirillales bacterium]|jgi:branched-chain amino acid transport system substrate-binding protein|nr:branched-chain amino acid transporter substrate-binding protein [Rhodospirillales bacterium]